jgi:hypothetical protein
LQKTSSSLFSEKKSWKEKSGDFFVKLFFVNSQRTVALSHKNWQSWLNLAVKLKSYPKISLNPRAQSNKQNNSVQSNAGQY